MSFPPEVIAAILSLDNNVNELLSEGMEFDSRVNTTLEKADAFLDKANPLLDKVDNIENQLNKIEHLLFAILIVVLVMVSIMFVYWFFGHIWPMLAGHHKHQHDMRHILRDLGTTPTVVVQDTREAF